MWPRDIAGSLSHCRTAGFAAVGRREEVGTLGIDVEDGPGLPEELWPCVLLPEECDWPGGLSAAARRRLALVMFSAKESLYKAQYPRTKRLMDFHDLRVEPPRFDRASGRSGTFSCTFQRTIGAFSKGTAVPGRFRYDAFDGQVVTTVRIGD